MASNRAVRFSTSSQDWPPLVDLRTTYRSISSRLKNSVPSAA